MASSKSDYMVVLIDTCSFSYGSSYGQLGTLLAVDPPAPSPTLLAVDPPAHAKQKFLERKQN